MTLSSNVNDLALRVATEAKALRTLLNGNAVDNSALLTTAKSNLLAAINELTGRVDGLEGSAAGINDAVTSTSSTWSSQKTRNEIDTAVAGIDVPVLTDLIDDVTASTSTVYSSTKTDAQISAAVSALVDAAPGTLDTLNELAQALGDDANFATTINTALGNRVRFDAAQTLTDPQKAQARTNIDAASATEVGSTTTNYVSTFEAGLLP
jgi:hypothetical protein